MNTSELFASTPAKWTDTLNIYDSNRCSKFFKSIGSRISSTLLFGTCAWLDTANQGRKYVSETFQAYTTSDLAERAAHFEKAAKCWSTLQTCAFCATMSPFGLTKADIVTRHFLPKGEEKNNIRPYGKLYEAKGIEQIPHTAEDIQNIVKEAVKSNKQVSVSGSRLCQGKQILPTNAESIVIDMRQMQAVTVDTQTKTAKVQAGATWREVQEAANKEGLAVQVMQASNIFSVGGSLSVNCHGWDHIQGSLSNTIKSLTVVDAEGNLKVVKPEDEHFKLIIGGYGLFGIVVEAEIQLADNHRLMEWGEEISPENYLDYFKSSIQSSKDIGLHLYRLSLEPDNLFNTGVAVSWSKVKTGLPNKVSHLYDEPESGTRYERVMLQVARYITYSRKIWWNQSKGEMAAPKTITRNELMRAPIKAAMNNSMADAEWLQEYFVPGEELAPFLKMLSSTLMKNNVSLFNASVRFVKKDECAKLAYAPEDRFAIVLFFNQSLAKEKVKQTEAWVREVTDYLIKHNGTYYLPYQHFATQEQFRACYPSWKEVAKKKMEYDPKHTFHTGFCEDYLHDEAVKNEVQSTQMRKV